MAPGETVAGVAGLGVRAATARGIAGLVKGSDGPSVRPPSSVDDALRRAEAGRDAGIAVFRVVGAGDHLRIDAVAREAEVPNTRATSSTERFEPGNMRLPTL